LIEHEYARDWTNWWIPNAACSAAMLRTAGFEILEHPEADVFLCRASEPPKGPGAVYPARPEASLQAADRVLAKGKAR
jgi:tRNA (mo5U34)-methyltransferase